MRSAFFTLLACCLGSCSRRAPEPVLTAPPKPGVETPALTVARAVDASSASDAAIASDSSTAAALADADPKSAAGQEVRRAWPRVALDDAAPLCVFADYDARAKAPFRKQAGKKLALRAGKTLVFGAYAPSACINEQCDDAPTLQCWVEQEGTTLTVRSRYRARHKTDSQCSENCREVTAGCPTEPLAAGTYTVKHGEKSITLKVPSVLRSSCLPGD